MRDAPSAWRTQIAAQAAPDGRGGWQRLDPRRDSTNGDKARSSISCACHHFPGSV